MASAEREPDVFKWKRDVYDGSLHRSSESVCELGRFKCLPTVRLHVHFRENFVTLFKKSFRLKMVFNRVGPVCLELTAASSKIVLKVSKLEAENYNSFRMRCGMIVHIQHYLFYVTTRFIFLFTILLTLSYWTTLQHKISFSFSVDLKKIAHFYIFTWDYCVALNVMIFNTCLNKDRK